jgi:dienelactone hydrolase
MRRTTAVADVLLFHHSLGLTPGVVAFAGQLRAAGHNVHTPDFYDGRTFGTIEAGVAYAGQLGSAELRERAGRIADGLGTALVYAGFSLGVELAQMLAQTRPGARGMLMFDGCIRPAEFGTSWPSGVPVQIHGMENDPYFIGYELDAARELVASARQAELFLYPGDRHLFADSSLPWYDAGAAALLTERVLGFLGQQ